MSDLPRLLRSRAAGVFALKADAEAMEAAADALEAAEADLARLEHQLQQAEEATSAAYKDAEAAEAKLAAIRDHCRDNLAARTLSDYENGYDGACLDILDILEEK